MKKTILHVTNAYINRNEYRAIEVDGVVKIQRRRAGSSRWHLERAMSRSAWDAWEADANLTYNSLAIYELLDHRTEREKEDEWTLMMYGYSVNEE